MRRIFLILLLAFSVNAQFMHTPRNIQSPYVAADFWAQWSSVNPRMALFILVTPQTFWASVNPVGFTSNTRDMTLPGHPGITFRSSPGITPTVVEQALGEAGNLEMTGIYQSSIFERTDVLAGKWNFASVEVFSACWNNTNLGELVHFTGNLGEFKDYEIYFTGEGRGPIDRLVNDVNKVTQRSCRVKEFRDAECKHTSSTVTIDGDDYEVEQTGLVIAAGSGLELDFSTADFTGNTPPLDLFRNGKITSTSGDNEGVSREIAKQLADNDGVIQIILKRPFPFAPNETVDTFDLVTGCRRTVEDCRKYENIVNFRGEPYVPGIESANRISSGN